ncbi:hypothetical protein SDC9_206400 [bioreactor metagenome]|uniref:Uncharacterized protein n=1 Tax=bioreactor metagenome TaxID=1076179 RepID=A0A645J7L9_9ZZZZ
MPAWTTILAEQETSAQLKNGNFTHPTNSQDLFDIHPRVCCPTTGSLPSILATYTHASIWDFVSHSILSVMKELHKPLERTAGHAMLVQRARDHTYAI